ncbi:AdoMet-dependent rRNA methyltransferase spb1 [Tulasnella sp. 418]|nr:AdoMet-dependent rRNA methyltransferase spb1 [Tulasnella sp. 418]
MGKSTKKTGKGRLDKYYKLAKEQGYRARSAFKLIQLNKKFSFLESARVCIDLCAAPGGWLQVASKYMPVGSTIIGCDLVPIKPIPRVITFPCDITTPQCRTLIRSHLKDWKADVVLHDGAPNVGTAWVQDAYTQVELVLSSLKLAVDFLRKGGTFVTKVFRSQDYNNLIWVFGQLFGKVEATKPPSSRNVSAEIFVVCTNYLAPAHIDPKFLDPKHVFKDVESLPPAPVTTSKPDSNPNPTASNIQVLNPSAINVFQPSKKYRHRDGYADGVSTLFKAGSASDFIRSTGTDVITFLGSVNKIEFKTDEEKEWKAMDITTADIKANCEDLKVLGKGDFKALLKWRASIREEIGLDVKAKHVEDATETVVVTEPVDEEAQIQEELERVNEEQRARRKRERKRANEKRQREVQKMQLRMVAPMDIGMEFQDRALGGGADIHDVFDLGEAEKKGVRTAIERNEDGEESETESSQEEEKDDDDEEGLDSEDEKERKLEGLEAELDGLYDSYRTKVAERDTKWRVKEARRKDKDRDEKWGGIGQGDQSEDSGSDEDGEDEHGGWEDMQAAKEHDEESDSEDDESSAYEHEQDYAPPTKRRKIAGGGSATRNPVKDKPLVTKLNGLNPRPSTSKAAQVWFSQDIFNGVGDLSDMTDDEPEHDSSDGEASSGDAMVEGSEDDDDFEVVPQEQDDATMWDVEDEDADEKKQRHINDVGLVTAEAITLAQQLVNRKTTKTHLINEGFNKHAFADKDGLPSWFLDDEAKFYKPNLPVTKEAIRMLREKQRALDARPIKKVAEAKARKKMRALRRIEKAVKKAEGVNESGEMTEKQKAIEVEKLMRKGLASGKTRKKNDFKVIVAAGKNKGVKGRPKGVKGRYMMVDARGKKELRAVKRKQKENKKRKR